jgi:hypothetical protein
MDDFHYVKPKFVERNSNGNQLPWVMMPKGLCLKQETEKVNIQWNYEITTDAEVGFLNVLR